MRWGRQEEDEATHVIARLSDLRTTKDAIEKELTSLYSIEAMPWDAYDTKLLSLYKHNIQAETSTRTLKCFPHVAPLEDATSPDLSNIGILRLMDYIHKHT